MTLNLRARSPEDLIAAVPIVLGFTPHESVVMLGLAGERPYHCRIDLPPPTAVEEWVEALLAPACRHGLEVVAFVVFTADAGLARRAAAPLSRAFEGAGVRVAEVLRCHERRWYAPLGIAGVPDHGVPFDPDAHAFRAEATVAGMVVEPSREALAARLAADRWASETVAAELATLLDDEREARTTPDSPVAGFRVALGGDELAGLLDHHAVSGTVPDDHDAARLLWSTRLVPLRDRAWHGLSRHDAELHVPLWSDLVRRAPEGTVAGAASVLAMLAWRSGNGALAWCALDCCFEEDPDHSLGVVVSGLLQHAVAPDDDWLAVQRLEVIAAEKRAG